MWWYMLINLHLSIHPSISGVNPIKGIWFFDVLLDLVNYDFVKDILALMLIIEIGMKFSFLKICLLWVIMQCWLHKCVRKYSSVSDLLEELINKGSLLMNPSRPRIFWGESLNYCFIFLLVIGCLFCLLTLIQPWNIRWL